MVNIYVKLFLNLDQRFRRRCHLKKKFTDNGQLITIAHHEGGGGGGGGGGTEDN